MGHRLTPAEETAALKDATREAHEAMQGLKGLLRECRELAATLTADYQAYHDRELKELANALARENNQISADLNRSVQHARRMIFDKIMCGEAVFDVSTRTVTIKWGPELFDADQPLPYPEVAPKENTE